MSQANEEKGFESESQATLLPERIPEPTVWPVALSLGITLLAFGVVTSWIISAFGLGLSLLSAYGWLGDLRNDLLQ